MSDARIAPLSTKNNIRRKHISNKTTSNFTIIALLTLSVCGGRFALGGAGRRVAAGGLLKRIIGISFEGLRKGGSSNRSIYGAFVSAVPLTPSSTRSSSSPDTSMESSSAECPTEPDNCSESGNKPQPLMPPSRKHPDDPNLWLYHVETTTSTMDEAKRIVEKKFVYDDTQATADGDSSHPTSFLISATSQSNGRGTTQRNWKSSQKGNALFTIGIQQSSWINDLKSQNNGMSVPLTLLPLKVGSLVASHIQRVLRECVVKSSDPTQQMIPRVTVKWPNDVLLHGYPTQENIDQLAVSSAGKGSYDKIAGILIESAQDWFLVGIGINVGYAPDIPKEGVDYGRQATSLSQYCNSINSGEESAVINDEANSKEEHWIQVSKKLASDIAYDLHSWLHPLSPSPFNAHYGESILNQWKSYIDWEMELILRDTPQRQRVKLVAILEDGRVVVQELETGLTRTLVTDYFL